MRPNIHLWFAVAALTVGGCSALNKDHWPADTARRSWNPAHWFDKEYQTPQSIAVIWSPEVLTVPGQPTTRGFGGRIYFYNAKSQAIPVDGDLIVYAYRTTDEHRKDADLKVAADKKFVFAAEQLTRHFSPSQLGASYSIWVPWGDSDGFREEITLIPTFKSKDGGILQGAPAKVFLPGKPRDGEETLPLPSQQVSYRQSTIPAYDVAPISPQSDPARSGIETTTIPIPLDSTLSRPRAVSAGTQATSSEEASGGGANATRRVWELHPAGPIPGSTSAALAPTSTAVPGPRTSPDSPTSIPAATNNHPAVSSTTGGAVPMTGNHFPPAAAHAASAPFSSAAPMRNAMQHPSAPPSGTPHQSAFSLQPWPQRPGN